MSSTFVPSHWPEAAGPTPVFGRRVLAAGPAGGGAGIEWLLKRNCSITPQQLGAVYASLCGVSALIAGFFFWHGAPFVAAFAGIELAAVGAAMLVFARHAGDRETLTLRDRLLHVESRIGNRVESTELAVDWLTVEPAAGQGSLVQLRGRGHRVQVGRFVRPELRGAFAQELRHTLRQLPAGHDTENDLN